MYDTIILNLRGSIALLARMDNILALVRLDTRKDDKLNWIGAMPEINFHKDKETLEENWKKTIEISEKNGWVITGNTRNFG